MSDQEIVRAVRGREPGRMNRPELRIELPAGLPGDCFADIVRAVTSLLELWSIPAAPAVLVGEVDGAGTAVVFGGGFD